MFFFFFFFGCPEAYGVRGAENQIRDAVATYTAVVATLTGSPLSQAGIEPASQRSREAPNPHAPQKELQEGAFALF